MVKPLFIPLKAKYYEAFLSGVKDTEYRAFGKRWNHKTCYAGRAVVLSKGYGKGNRINAIISSASIGIPGEEFKEIYGAGIPVLEIKLIDLIPQKPNKPDGDG
jgi:hypothetical protein